MKIVRIKGVITRMRLADMPNERFDLLSLQDAMDILGVSRATIDRWRKDKQLPHIKIGKEIWIDKNKLQAWIHLHSNVHELKSAPKEAASVREITVGYQSGAALLWSTLIIKKMGLFEEELRQVSPSVDYRVQWIDAPNGMELVEELISGNVHIASIGDYPIVASRALSHILPRFQPLFLAFDGKTPNGGGISLVAPSGRPVSRPEDLAQSTISTVGHSSASYRLQEWMQAFGLESDPVVHRTMGDCLNGIMEGNVGASVMWEPYLSWVQSIGAGVPILSQGFDGDYLTGLMADGNWVRGNEDVVIAYLKAHLRAHEFIRKESARAAGFVSEASGFPVSIVAGVLSQIRWDASLYSRDLQTLNRLSEGQSEWLPTSKTESGGFEFRKQYLQYAVEALKLPDLPDSPLPGDWSRENLY
jgi:NitT/TauT family transport system substrate-binding protein